MKVEQPPAEAKPAPAPQRVEKAEKHEKKEKKEKTEKYEKRELRFIGPLIGGLILIFLGLISYLQVIGFVGREAVSALFLILIGIIIIIGALIAARRHPKT
ncbi:MAG: hypothetical protein OEY95_06580 [Candidatus Bathyarchaeota archaeon]|nr:hypothetical protein [Candidatus Bathyarchaeota archaeon]